DVVLETAAVTPLAAAGATTEQFETLRSNPTEYRPVRNSPVPALWVSNLSPPTSRLIVPSALIVAEKTGSRRSASRTERSNSSLVVIELEAISAPPTASNAILALVTESVASLGSVTTPL